MKFELVYNDTCVATFVSEKKQAHIIARALVGAYRKSAANEGKERPKKVNFQCRTVPIPKTAAKK